MVPLEASTVINDLPEEMIRNVFNHLSPNDIVNCSKVCVYWKNLVEGLGECFWMKRYSQEYPDVFEDGQRTSGLSRRQMYHSLRGWEDINEFQDSSYAQHMPHEAMGTVCFLENNIICYPIRRRLLCHCCNDEHYEASFYAVVYFDVKKREFVKKRTCGVNFKNYRESDDIIVIELILGDRHLLRISSKSFHIENKEQVIYFFVEECSWFVVNNDVYYQSKEDKVKKLHRLRAIQERGDVRFENSVLVEENNEHEILAIVPFDRTVHLLLRGRSNCKIYVMAVKNNALHLLEEFEHKKLTPTMFQQELSRFGFYLSNPDVNREILKMQYYDTQLSAPESIILHGPYRMTFSVTCHRDSPESWMLNVHIAPNGLPAQPQILKFKIESIAATVITEIDLIQIIECGNGHIIVFGYYECTNFDEEFRKLMLIYIDHNVVMSLKRMFDTKE